MSIYRARSLIRLAKSKSNFNFTSPHLPVPCSIRRISSSIIPSHLERVGFIGLGNMGSRMASNLIKAGYNVAVHDINLSVIKMFSDKGISVKGSPREVAEMSDVVITMLPSPSHVLDVYTGPNGLLNGGNLVRPWLFIDSSTVDPQTTRKLSSAVSNCALIEKKDSWETPVMLDAPVSGGILAAETGTLTFMVGGPEEVYKATEPIFSSMGKNTIYCGNAGTGSAAKICNNLSMAVSMLGVSEAFVLGQSLGITASTLTKIFNSSTARCWSSDTYNPVPGVIDGVPSSRNYDGGFASTLMAKDLNLASSSAKELGLKCPLASEAKDIYAKLCEDGHGTKDFSCAFRHFYSGKDEL
ncbi:probable 3-hydroxyisobutyrate dehydrogenase, mitochondrial [Cynara cardunculus var. scolymus]|uniref:3-hydroxyisobutyrate dehydrogenase n=1 Tax=Cynara cardunculus var. scolymus TaxID=59895 RepID=A0A103Y6J4_CYNCS|nr:probable 3-hydroxyisobutyrate dehydrogenase, mitochondrial [Cynara cardunculus var. scolymus]KVI03458.1 3-hydroxyisobutyrate dehydrogenase [Cynara cardunculus var. scolymus]